MSFIIEQVEHTAEGSVTWFLASYVTPHETQRGSFHVRDVSFEEEGDMAVVWCAYHQWGTPLHGLFVCLRIHRSEDAWETLGLSSVSRSTKGEPMYSGSCHDFPVWAEGQRIACMSM